MFPINHPFCFPMVFYTHPQFLFPNAQILPMNPNLYSTDKLQSESSSNVPSCQRTERGSSKELQDDGKWFSVKREDKQKELMKKKIIGKKTFKQVDSAEQAQRLRKKLANRPKTYQTEKKMYMNTDLSTLGCSDTNKRMLRKRPSAMKKIKILKEKSSSQERQSFQEIQQQSFQLEDTDQKKSNSKILNTPQKILGFYDPHATLPKAEQTFQDKKQIELKKMNLLSRKVDFVTQSTF